MSERSEVKKCARCGEDHENVEVRKLTRPMAPAELTPMVWDHWFLCPTLGEPAMQGTWYPDADGKPVWPEASPC